jgi:dihydrofolate reductase
MGRFTWIDPMMPKPLKNRVNILVTNKSPLMYPGADKYISGNIISKINEISKEYKSLTKWVIGGPKVVNQLFDIIDEFYLTRIYGSYNCDKKIDIKNIEKKMLFYKKIENDDTCHFEIWKK